MSNLREPLRRTIFTRKDGEPREPGVSHFEVKAATYMSHWKGRSLRFPSFSAYWIGALVMIALAIAIRIWLIALGWPLLDSDEGTMGLMALHIAFKGEVPIFFYGQSYMGAAEAYLGALAFHFFGVSAFTLRLGMIFFFALFLLFLYQLTCLLFTRMWALIILLFLALGSDAILTRELVAVGGDAETLVSGTLLMLLSVWLSLSTSYETQRKRRLLAYAGWGIAAGFGVWSHLLVIPFILLGVILLVLFCRHEIFNRTVLKAFSWPLLTLIVTFIIGVFPLIVYNIQNSKDPAKNIFVVFWNLHRVSNNANIPGFNQGPSYLLLPYQIRDAFQISLPIATNASPLCSVSPGPDGVAILQAHAVSFSSPYAIQCTLTHTLWPLGVVALWIIASILALYSLKPYWHHFRSGEWSPEEKPIVVRQVGRLALLAISAITFGLFVLSPNAALFPVATSRYLIGLLVTTPALLWPLWIGVNAVKPLANRIAIAVCQAHLSVVLRQSILLLIGITFLLGTINTFTGIFPTPFVTARHTIFATQAIDQHLNVPATTIYNQDEHRIITRLQGLGIRYFYSDYWTCNRLIFQTREGLICTAISATDAKTFCAGMQASNTLDPANDPTTQRALVAAQMNIFGKNRYALYRQRLQRQKGASFVATSNSTLATLMARCASTSHIVYMKYISGGIMTSYVIYEPIIQPRS